MKSRITIWSTAATLFAVLALPIGIAAQESKPSNRSRRQTYTLIDLGTFGGPRSYNYGENSKSMNSHGIVVGEADTSMPDPNYPNFNPLVLESSDPYLQHAFEWLHGVLIDLGAIPGTNSSATAWVNEAGTAAGASNTGFIDPLNGWPAAEAVIWKHGSMIRLGDLGGHEGIANMVNDREQVSGFAANAIPDPYSLFGFATQTRAFVWEKGVMQDIGTLGGPDAWMFDLSNTGGVGFSYTNSIPNPTTGIPTVDPFLWVNGRMTDLGTLGGTFGGPEWINNRRQVIGESNLAGDLVSHPFLWDNGVLRDLGTLGGDNGSAFFINEAGSIVGAADLPGSMAHHGFIWKRGVMRDLGTLGTDPCSNATHINEVEQVVGTLTNCHGVVLHVFLWENGEMVDLNSLVSPPSEVQVIEPTFINDRGEITANATLSNGDEHAVILIPGGDCDSECEQRIAASQSNSVLPALGDRSSMTALRETQSTPLERLRNRMRQHNQIPRQISFPRD